MKRCCTPELLIISVIHLSTQTYVRREVATPFSQFLNRLNMERRPNLDLLQGYLERDLLTTRLCGTVEEVINRVNAAIHT